MTYRLQLSASATDTPVSVSLIVKSALHLGQLTSISPDAIVLSSFFSHNGQNILTFLLPTFLNPFLQHNSLCLLRMIPYIYLMGLACLKQGWLTDNREISREDKLVYMIMCKSVVF